VRPSSLGTISWLGSLCSSNLCRRCGNCARGGRRFAVWGAVSANSPGLIGTDQMCGECDFEVRGGRWSESDTDWICRSLPVSHEIRDWPRLLLSGTAPVT
jgi:hypothetical protein